MSNYKQQQNSNNWRNTQQQQQKNSTNDGFTVVQSKKNVKDNNTNNSNNRGSRSNEYSKFGSSTNNNYNNNKSYYSSSSTRSYNQPPVDSNNKNQQSQHSSNKKQTKKLSYEEQFPSINNTPTSSKHLQNNSTIRSNSPITHTPTPTPINNLNFKIAIDKPVSNIISSSSSIKKTTNQNIEEKETFDLSLYVKLQERRQKEYDYLYGEGAFVSDRLNYERYASDHESDDEDGEDINGRDAEDNVEVFEFDY
jgi:hypothetical protein